MGFDPQKEGYQATPNANNELQKTCEQIVQKLAAAERPVLMVGSGVRIANARDAMIRFVEKTGIPVVTAWNAHDLVWDSHPQYAGRPGTIGDRAGNFAVQNADVLLVVGSRLNVRQVSYTWKNFARNAYKIWVDIDPTELQKPTVVPDMPVVADAKEFFETLEKAVSPNLAAPKWQAWCKERVQKYPTVLPEYWESQNLVNPYCFVAKLFDHAAPDEVVVCGNGTACVVGFQAANLKPQQRIFTNSGCASMGYDVPAALGACIARNGKQVVCLAGDGSLMMNLQELQTIVGLNLPVKIFVLNNDGYHSIRQTQNAFFPDGKMGFDEATGVSFPSFEKLAQGFGLPYAKCTSHGQLSATIQQTLAAPGPFLCEVMLNPNQPFSPKLSSRKLPDGRMVSSPLEDLSPFLSREELAQNMFYPLMEESKA
jgi:acetolactate synthase-1/2/3 large subunit